jgi:drug/metabolite transporter (DMT)-like permease
VSRVAVWSLYAMLVVIWSSTWVAIKLGLEDTPPLLGAGVRFAAAGAVLLALTVARRRPLGTDRSLAVVLCLFPFAATYGLVYWGEQHIPSGLAAVLFGALPLYVSVMAAVVLPDEPLYPRLLLGVALALGGLVLAFGESVALGADHLAVAGAVACTLAPLAAGVGNVALRLRAGALDAVVLNGWAMLAAGALLLAASALAEDWGDAAWTAQALGSIAYLALIGTALAFVVLTILFGQLRAVTVSFITLLLPFGALGFGALLNDEAVTATALGGAALVAGGLLVAQRPRAARVP